MAINVDIPERPGAYKLNSAQIYGFNLRVALDRHHAYVDDSGNKTELDRLNNGHQPYTLFPPGYFPHATAPGLYLDAATRDLRGYASNGRLAEIPWRRVQYEKLSTTLALVDKHHALIEALGPMSFRERVDAQQSSQTASLKPHASQDEDSPLAGISTSPVSRGHDQRGSRLVGAEIGVGLGLDAESNAPKREVDVETTADNGAKRSKTVGGEIEDTVAQDAVRPGSRPAPNFVLKLKHKPKPASQVLRRNANVTKVNSIKRKAEDGDDGVDGVDGAKRRKTDGEARGQTEEKTKTVLGKGNAAGTLYKGQCFMLFPQAWMQIEDSSEWNRDFVY